MQNVNYEWDLETLDITDPTDPEVLDHEHSDTLKGLFTKGALHIEADRALCLVRTDHSRGGGREWAYITEAGGLPEFFQDAHQRNGSKVPQKFRREFDSVKSKITFAPTPTTELPPAGWRELQSDELIQSGDMFYGADPPSDTPKLHPSLSIGFTPADSVHGFRYFRKE